MLVSTHIPHLTPTHQTLIVIIIMSIIICLNDSGFSLPQRLTSNTPIVIILTTINSRVTKFKNDNHDADNTEYNNDDTNEYDNNGESGD